MTEKKDALVGYYFNNNLMHSIRGDKGLRESVYNRKRTFNNVDKHIDELAEVWLYLLLKTGVYRLVIGLNNAEVRIASVFDPFNTEVHLADDLLDADYIDFHFNKISLHEKDKLIRRIYQLLEQDSTFSLLSSSWQKALLDRNQQMQSLTQAKDLHFILKNVAKLRHLEGYYLRSITINLFNSTVSMSFNCDGTQIMSHKKFKHFIKEYL
jgi:N-formylglutamate amidohydrolase